MKKILMGLILIASNIFSIQAFAHGGYWFPGFVTGAIVGGAVANSYQPSPYVYYPYPPAYAQTPIYIQQPAVSQPPYATQGDMTTNMSQAPNGNNWYYCQKTKSYYPYVSTCPSGWKIVPSTPPDLMAR